MTLYTNTHRHAKDRCMNKNNKDFIRYQGKWGFADYTEFHFDNYENFKENWLKHGKDSTIDRINNDKGYEPKNVRWVTMTENLRNKDCVKSIKAVNVLTGEIIIMPSFTSCREYSEDFKSVSGVFGSYQRGNLYKRKWKFETIDED